MAQSRDNSSINRPGLSLRQTFDIYLQAIRNSDLKALFTTVSKSDRFYFLTASGKLIDREGYYDFHRDWFDTAGWEMPVSDIEVFEYANFGFVRAIFHYREPAADNRIYNLDSYFTLIFHKEDDMWKVIADICTPIEKYFTVKDTGEKI